MNNIAIFDPGLEDLTTVLATFSNVGPGFKLTSSKEAMLESAALVLPSNLDPLTLIELSDSAKLGQIIDQRLAGGKPVLALGSFFNLLFETLELSDQHLPGLGQWPGNAIEVSSNSPGWSKIETTKDSKLFESMANEEFYFETKLRVESFPLVVEPPFVSPKVSYSTLEKRFVAAIENGPLVATQIRVELSGAAGKRLLTNWIESL